MNIWFATSVWERDYKVTLHKKRVWMNWHATGKEFSGRLLVLNNFQNKDLLEKAKHKASAFVEQGFFSDWIHAPEYIKGKLDQFNLNETSFWLENPYFSSIELAFLLYLQGKADFVFYMSGDVSFCDVPHNNWLSIALDKYKKASISGFNIYYRRWKEYYPNHKSHETNDFYINKRTYSFSKINTPLRNLNITLSDLAFLIPVSPSTPYDFNLDRNAMKRYAPMWPNYAIPCFEMFYTKYLDTNSMSYGVLKPIDGMPITKHKNIKRPLKRILRQRILGAYYANGMYGTKIKE